MFLEETVQCMFTGFWEQLLSVCLPVSWGWSGGAMVLGELPVPGRPTIWI